MILSIAIATSLLLGVLLAAALLARAGLRGRWWLLLGGLVGGLVIGPVELVVNTSHGGFFGTIQSLELQFLAIGAARAMVYGLLTAVAISLTMHLASRQRRRGDIWSVAAGVGLGLGVSTTILILVDPGSGWPPARLIAALVNIPFQLCYVMIVAAAVIRARFPAKAGALRPLAIHAGGCALQAVYQAILTATAAIGHWLAWIEPTTMGFVWLGLIALIWVTGLALLASQRLVAFADEHHPAASGAPVPLVLRAWPWRLTSVMVLLPAWALFALVWWLDLESVLGRVMIYTLIAMPLLAAGLCLRTALALQPLPARAAE